MIKNTSCAIVSTIIHCYEYIDSFIDYHLAKGFEHIFLFFDDPNDKAIPRLARRSSVTVIPNDDALKERWR